MHTLYRPRGCIFFRVSPSHHCTLISSDILVGSLTFAAKGEVTVASFLRNGP